RNAKQGRQVEKNRLGNEDGANGLIVQRLPRTRAEGAPIPSQVADQLRGVRFSNFGRQRESIWKAVANDSEISQQFSQRNLQLMKAGNAPHPKLEDQVGRRTKFEIHHKDEIANGGSVYDVDNLVIMTPKQHIEHHRNRSQ
ncbi:HNH endonuclease signature motif containing protein, partial [Pseudomonas syringae]|uniref:HNH endonuclease signature motif containing protein n=2 Tax=Pseudomonas syringae group TaxID=136849 RepID=UPI00211DE8B0